MPLWHCTGCHHEWEGIKTDNICNWCQATGYVLTTSTPLESLLSGMHGDGTIVAFDMPTNLNDFLNDAVKAGLDERAKDDAQKMVELEEVQSRRKEAETLASALLRSHVTKNAIKEAVRQRKKVVKLYERVEGDPFAHIVFDTMKHELEAAGKITMQAMGMHDAYRSSTELYLILQWDGKEF